MSGVSAGPGVSVAVVRALIGAVERAGVERAQFLTATGLDASQLGRVDGRLPRAEVHRLCALAMELTRDPALGLHWSEQLDECSYDPLSHLAAHAATMRQALQLLTRFHRLLSDAPRFELIERDEDAIVRVMLMGDTVATRRFLAEMAVSGIFQQFRKIKTHPVPKLVSFEHAAPAYEGEYERIFGGSVCFEQRFTGLIFDRALLDVPSLRSDAEVRETLEELAERRLRRLHGNTSYSTRVRDYLMRERKGARTEMSTVARALRLSVRSLRRRLAVEGTGYGEIVDDTLAEAAERLLCEERLTIQETAYELGFASFSAFHRAFRRSTGMTPTAFRTSTINAGTR